MKGGGKNKKLLDKVEKTPQRSRRRRLRVFRGKVKGTPAFKAAEVQAAAIVAALTGK